MAELMMAAFGVQKKLTPGCKADTVLDTVKMQFPDQGIDVLMDNGRKATCAVIRDKINTLKGMKLQEATQRLQEWLQGSSYKRKACSSSSGSVGDRSMVSAGSMDLKGTDLKAIGEYIYQQAQAGARAGAQQAAPATLAIADANADAMKELKIPKGNGAPEGRSCGITH